MDLQTVMLAHAADPSSSNVSTLTTSPHHKSPTTDRADQLINLLQQHLNVTEHREQKRAAECSHVNVAICSTRDHGADSVAVEEHNHNATTSLAIEVPEDHLRRKRKRQDSADPRIDATMSDACDVMEARIPASIDPEDTQYRAQHADTRSPDEDEPSGPPPKKVHVEPIARLSAKDVRFHGRYRDMLEESSLVCVCKGDTTQRMPNGALERMAAANVALGQRKLALLVILQFVAVEALARMHGRLIDQQSIAPAPRVKTRADSVLKQLNIPAFAECLAASASVERLYDTGPQERNELVLMQATADLATTFSNVIDVLTDDKTLRARFLAVYGQYRDDEDCALIRGSVLTMLAVCLTPRRGRNDRTTVRRTRQSIYNMVRQGKNLNVIASMLTKGAWWLLLGWGWSSMLTRLDPRVLEIAITGAAHAQPRMATAYSTIAENMQMACACGETKFGVLQVSIKLTSCAGYLKLPWPKMSLVEILSPEEGSTSRM